MLEYNPINQRQRIMAQQTTIAPEAEIEDNDAVAVCRHHWVIQPAAP